jgi:SAM-dependent methyltransferase
LKHPAPSGARAVEFEIPGDYQLKALQSGWRLQRAWHRARLDLVARVLPPSGRGLALDAAAGAGIVTWRFGAAAIVSADMRQAACAAVRAHTPGARTVAGMLDCLPFATGTFSQVYFLEALEHLTPDEGASALRELRRVSQRGGLCLVTTPNYRSHWSALERVLDTLGLTPPMANEQHVSGYDRRSLAGIIGSAGWTVRHVGSFNLFAPVVGAMSQRAGTWALALEADHLRGAGALLFALCEHRS